MLLALAGVVGGAGGCGGDGGGGTTDVVADVVIDTAVDTTTGTTTDAATSSDASDAVDATPTCAVSEFYPGRELFVTNDVGGFGWSSFSAVAADVAFVTFEDRGGDPLPTGPFTFEIGSDEADRSLLTCERCVSIQRDCDILPCAKTYIATAGTVEITALDAASQVVAGRMTNVRLVEVGADGATAEDGGETWCVDELVFDTRPECTTDADCTTRTGDNTCYADWQKCVACVNSFDCADASAPACRADLTTGQPTCMALPDCSANDPGEHDDGPAAARTIVPGTPLTASICLTPDESDWYRIDLAEASNVAPDVMWQGSVALALELRDASGERLEVIAQSELEAGQNHLRGLWRGLPAGTYYLYIYAADGPTGTIPYTFSVDTTPACDAHADCTDGWCVNAQCTPARDCTVPGVDIVLQTLVVDAFSFNHSWFGAASFDESAGDIVLTMTGTADALDPFPDGPGTYPLGARPEDLGTLDCARCVKADLCDQDGCKPFYSVSGAVEVSLWEPDVGRFEGRLVDLVLVELTPPDFIAVNVEGAVMCFEPIAIDTDPVCASSAQCGGDPCFVSGAGSACVGCLTDATCGGETDLCDPARRECAECVTSADCRTEPVCVQGTCTIVDECVGDDLAEHLDDGVLGATPVALEAEVERKICGLAGTTSALEADWFSHAATSTGLVDFGARVDPDATVAATITVIVHDPSGLEVARETSDSGTTIVRHQVTPGTWTIQVKTLDVDPAAPITYTLRVARP